MTGHRRIDRERAGRGGGGARGRTCRRSMPRCAVCVASVCLLPVPNLAQTWSGLQSAFRSCRSRLSSSWRFLEFSASTALTSRSVAEAVMRGATKNCAKRSTASSRCSWRTEKWYVVLSAAGAGQLRATASLPSSSGTHRSCLRCFHRRGPSGTACSSPRPDTWQFQGRAMGWIGVRCEEAYCRELRGQQHTHHVLQEM